MSEELGRLYQQIETRNGELSESLEQQTATSDILGVIASSPTDIQPVLDAVAASAARFAMPTMRKYFSSAAIRFSASPLLASCRRCKTRR